MVSRGTYNHRLSVTLMWRSKWTPWVSWFPAEWLEKCFVWGLPWGMIFSFFTCMFNGIIHSLGNEAMALWLATKSSHFLLVICGALPFSSFQVNLAYLRSCLFCKTSVWVNLCYCTYHILNRIRKQGIQYPQALFWQFCLNFILKSVTEALKMHLWIIFSWIFALCVYIFKHLFIKETQDD